jgi:hypothetical protein
MVLTGTEELLPIAEVAEDGLALSAEELKKFDGTDGSPLYLAIMGRWVYTLYCALFSASCALSSVSRPAWPCLVFACTLPGHHRKVYQCLDAVRLWTGSFISLHHYN